MRPPIKTNGVCTKLPCGGGEVSQPFEGIGVPRITRSLFPKGNRSEQVHQQYELGRFPSQKP